MRDPLLDKDFLLKLDNDRNRLVYIKLISLNFEEEPVEEINGRVTSGSINIDGSSSVRRTCSLSLIANELNIHEFYWGLRTKFKCFVGLENRIDSQYPDVIYFPMGTYIITSFSTSQGISSYTVSISGKDKMCLLNGDIGGVITAISVDFGKLTEQAIDGSLTKTNLLLKDIIREVVREYAHEPAQNIIINDLDEAALELMEYRGKDPLYLVISNESGEVVEQTLKDATYYLPALENPPSVNLFDIDDDTYKLDHRINLDFENKEREPTQFYASAAAAIKAQQIINAGGVPTNYYTVCKAETGDVVGYRLTDLTYAGDLIGSVGESITSILDKIKNMLGDYEYFYNLDGQFVWQRKPTYTNISWNNLVQNDGDPIHGESAAYSSAVTYSFENHNLLSSFSNNPNLLNIKNDYSIFGQKTLSSGTQIPVHLRYAIDKKPLMYHSYDGQLYISREPREGELRIVEVIPKSEEEIAEVMSQTYERMYPVPEGLTDDWWDIWDWGEYYKQLTGEYPNDIMAKYTTTVTTIDLESIFTVGRLPVQVPNVSPGRWEDPSAPCFLFDTLTVDGTTYLCYTGHNPTNVAWLGHYCVHKYYSYFMVKYIAAKERGCEFHAYFYKPRLPMPVIEDIIDQELVFRIKEPYQVVDWREIIYQMASDYMKHGMTDENNYEKVKGKVLTKDDIAKGLYYIKESSYIRETAYDKHRTYYIYVEDNDGNGSYVEAQNQPNQDTNFAQNAYYYKNVHNNYKLATEFKENETYYQYVDFLYRLRTYNENLYPNGITGYEQYYTDIMSFWRDLYDPNYVGTYKIAGVNKTLYYKEGSRFYWFKNQEDESYQSNIIYFTQDLYGNWRAHKNVTEDDFNSQAKYYYLPIQGIDGVEEESTLDDDHIFYANRHYYTFEDGEYYPGYTDETYTYIDDYGEQKTANVRHPYAYWNKNIWTNPEDLVFWFDFLDTDGELSQYSVPRIGDRPKAENNTDIKAVYYRETPNVIFVNTDEEQLKLKITKPGYTFISLNNSIDHLFRISSQRQSCKDRLNTLLYQNTVAAETISINSIPIYYLQPNTRIYVTDENSHINGEYIVSKIGFQLSHNGMMSISASKSIDRIY